MFKRFFVLTSLFIVISPVALATQTNTTLPQTTSQEASSQASFPASWNKSVGIATYYDDELGMIADLKYKHAFNKLNAGAIEVEGGERIARINATYGRILNPNNRIKLSLERLEEKLDYDFDSGTRSRWDGQNAIGADYQYLLHQIWLNSFHLGGYYTHANSKRLDAKQFDYEGSTLTNTRRITGGNSGNISTGVDFKLWPQSRFHVDLDYDTISYDTKYDFAGDGDDDDTNTHGFGTTLGLDQVILPQLKASVNTELRKPYKDYEGSLSYLLPSPKKTQLELSYITDYMHSLSTHRNFFSNGLRLDMSWDQTYKTTPKPHYTLAKTPKLTLADWTAMPAVRMTEVLAITDEVSRNSSGNIIPVSRMMTDSCPAVFDVDSEANIINEGNGFYTTKDKHWFTAQRSSYDFPVHSFQSAQEINHGSAHMIECIYNTEHNHSIALVNSNPNEYVETPTGSNWLMSSASEHCYGHRNSATGGFDDNDPTACTFEYDKARFAQANKGNAKKAYHYLKTHYQSMPSNVKNVAHKIKQARLAEHRNMR